MRNRATSTRVWNVIKHRSAGTTISLSAIKGQVQNAPSSALGNAISKMIIQGGMKRVGKGSYIVTQELLDWGNKRQWNEQYTYGGKPRAHKQAELSLAPTKPCSDLCNADNVLDKLLEVMAAAEPEIRRLREVERKLQEIMR